MTADFDWQRVAAAVWRPSRQALKPIHHVDPVSLADLVGIDRQKDALLDNTRRFIEGKPCNNALLWGARGTGKSSLIKAIFNHYLNRGLRLIEVFKSDLHSLHDIVDHIRDTDFHFIVYCDDFSFSADDRSYSGLKTILEGSVEAAPANVLLYTTSNRRHLVPQTMEENRQSKVVDGVLHLADEIEEKIALSDRFGLRLSFHPIDQSTYLQIIGNYFRDYDGDLAELHKAAIRFATERGSRSGRTARQFYNSYAERD